MDVERFIFDMYKDDVVVSKKFKRHIKEKFGIDPRQAHDIFAKICNYQIAKYGKCLELQDSWSCINKQECERLRKLAAGRRYRRKHRGE